MEPARHRSSPTARAMSTCATSWCSIPDCPGGMSANGTERGPPDCLHSPRTPPLNEGRRASRTIPGQHHVDVRPIVDRSNCITPRRRELSMFDPRTRRRKLRRRVDTESRDRCRVGPPLSRQRDEEHRGEGISRTRHESAAGPHFVRHLAEARHEPAPVPVPVSAEPARR